MREDLKTRLLEGEDLFLKGAYPQALQTFEAVLEEDPSNPYALNDAGLAYAELGQLDRAVECFERALQADPGHENAFLNLLNLLIEHEIWDLAYEAYAVYGAHVDQNKIIEYKLMFENKKVQVDDNQSVIIILGMHRSGTSTISRIANLLGVYMGEEEDFLEIKLDNPKGYWENEFIVSINDEILRRLGSQNSNTWIEIPIFFDGWEDSVIFNDLKYKAIAYLNKKMRGKEIWGWKDPRTCLTLPFWKNILPNKNLKFIICLRNPLSVSNSLKKRNNSSLEKGLVLWFRHNMLILKHTKSFPKIIIQYENVVDVQKRENVIEKIAKFIGVDKLENVKYEIENFIDENLCHNKVDLKDLNLAQINPLIKMLYFGMCMCEESGKYDNLDMLYDIMHKLTY